MTTLYFDNHRDALDEYAEAKRRGYTVSLKESSRDYQEQGLTWKVVIGSKRRRAKTRVAKRSEGGVKRVGEDNFWRMHP